MYLPCTCTTLMLTFRNQHRRYSTVYVHDRDLDLQDVGLAQDSWLAHVLKFMSNSNRLRPGPTSQQNDFFSVLILAARDQEWLVAANLDHTNFDLDCAISALRQFSLTVAVLPLSPGAKANGILNLRKWIRRFGVAKELPMFSRLNQFFKTPVEYAVGQSGQIGMVSDVLWNENENPIGATSHDSASDLKRKLGLRIRSTLLKVRTACIAELDSAARLSSALTTEMASHLDPELADELKKATVDKLDHFSLRDQPWITDLEPMQLLAGYHELMTLSEREIEKSDRAAPIRFSALRTRELTEFLAERFGSGFEYMNKGLQVGLFNALHGSFVSALACLLIIQTYTGWNVGSIIQLDEQKIKGFDDGGYEIQGFKTKTGDYTPTYFIEKNEHELLRAIEFLRNRLKRLKALGWVPKDCTDLWIRADGPNRAPTQWANWSAILAKFLRKYHLPQFTFTMMRNEVLAREANDRGGIEAARHVGGHTSIATTGHYVDQLLLHRRNSSISLQFQRALQGSVQYTFKSSHSSLEPSTDLLYPIGDGTSCIDPASPPFKSAASDGLCDATLCHAGSGCPNNRIVINTDRLEELIRFRRHFESTWNRRLDENPDRFVKVDLPAWNFNEALRGVIAAGPFRHRLKNLEAALGSKEGRS